MRKIPVLILILLLAACTLHRSAPIIEPNAGSGTPSGQPCYFNWATKSLPDLSTQVQAAMQTAGLVNINAIVEAYGEYCYDARTNQPVSFTAMETDFHVTVLVKDLTDRDHLGNLLEQILIVLDGFPPEMTPGTQAGYIRVTFQAGDNEMHLWFTVNDEESARTQGIQGAALLDKLQKR
jgi:hypothetical protein